MRFVKVIYFDEGTAADANGNSIGELNHDLDDIANAFLDFKDGHAHQQI